MAASSNHQWKTRYELLLSRWEKLAAEDKDDTFLLKASGTLQNLKDLCTEEKEKFNVTSFLHHYSKAVLDITFFEENQLVDGDFLDEDAVQKVQELIQVLSEPELLVEESNLHQKPPIVVLEVDLLECLHWRRGALLYMYCHTVGEREDWRLRNKRTFQKCLEDGVYHLLKMLKSRRPVHLNDEVSFQDLNTAELLSKGIFSDIHVLALMYCGEMCYWLLRYCRDEQGSDLQPNTDCSDRPPDTDCLDRPPNTDYSDRSSSMDCSGLPHTALDFKEIGEKVLEHYISVCEGPLCNQGWNTNNAKTILLFLKKGKM
ncbi:RAB7A-interacting MON1-CCZ1 complex subunit 1 [Rhinophrynus dorsalis]